MFCDRYVHQLAFYESIGRDDAVGMRRFDLELRVSARFRLRERHRRVVTRSAPAVDQGRARPHRRPDGTAPDDDHPGDARRRDADRLRSESIRHPRSAASRSNADARRARGPGVGRQPRGVARRAVSLRAQLRDSLGDRPGACCSRGPRRLGHRSADRRVGGGVARRDPWSPARSPTPEAGAQRRPCSRR